MIARFESLSRQSVSKHLRHRSVRWWTDARTWTELEIVPLHDSIDGCAKCNGGTAVRADGAQAQVSGHVPSLTQRSCQTDA